jgi:uncharacterized caspase-like protein
MIALRAVILLAFFIWGGCVPALADKRVALVIGNGAYVHNSRLPNPSLDAQDVAAALKRTDFEVISGIDLDQAQMQTAAIEFARAAKTADVAFFYYSGHAMQFNGVNYLMPVDARLDDEADLKRFTRVDDIMNDLQQAKNLRILVLDSCRDNPFAESLKRSIGLTRGAQLRQGLSRIEAPLGTIVSFSTQAGQTAVDGEGRNSPYTRAFLKYVEQPSEIGDVFRNISTEVYETSGRAQLPELSLSIVGKFYLKGPLTITIAPETAPAAPAASAPAAEAGPKMFDGAWDVTVACASQGKVASYARHLDASVKDGLFNADDSVTRKDNWLKIEGQIGKDGKAKLNARGITGDPKYSVNNVKPGVPYAYTIDAQFERTRGSGKRNELRPCSLVFAKK